MLRSIVLACVFGAALWLAGCDGGEKGDAGGVPAAGAAASRPAARPTIAVIPKGTTHVFWKSVEAGSRRAGEELGAEVLWKGPLTENDRAQQIQLVQQFISQGVDGIVLAPLDYKALVGPVRQARESGVPVVIFDSALEGKPGADFVSMVATDNQLGGQLAGRKLVELLGGEGKVVLLRYMVASASTDSREKGFLAAIAGEEKIECINDRQFAGATAGEAKTVALNLLDDLRRAQGVFCPNESSTLGMLLALQQEGLAGKIRFVGFDASPPLLQGLREGHIDALVVQNPRKMGYEAVRAMVRALRGEAVEPLVDTGCVVVTRENMETPEMRQLLE